jgi:hypothetical protein
VNFEQLLQKFSLADKDTGSPTEDIPVEGNKDPFANVG